VSVVTEILNRLSGISALRDQVTAQAAMLAEMRRVMIEQQKDMASLQGQMKALIQMQSQSPTPRPATKRSSG
jgi:uncharacterized coiled-coil protein SlyX